MYVCLRACEEENKTKPPTSGLGLLLRSTGPSVHTIIPLSTCVGVSGAVYYLCLNVQYTFLGC